MRGNITIHSVESLSAENSKEVTLRDSVRSVNMARFGYRTPRAPRLLSLAAGRAPARAKVEEKAAPTVAELVQRFLSEHAEAKRKGSTGKEYCRLLEHVVLPAIGKKRVADVNRQDMARLHHARRKTPTEANRVLAAMSTMFNMAERWGLRPDGSNPCRHVEKYPQRRRERFLSAAELSRLGDALAGYDGSPYHVAAIKLVVFTGARFSEFSAYVGYGSISTAARRDCRQ